MQQYLSLSPGPIAVNSLVYNHNGQLLLTGAADGRIRLYGLFVSQLYYFYGTMQFEQMSMFAVVAVFLSIFKSRLKTFLFNEAFTEH